MELNTIEVAVVQLKDGTNKTLKTFNPYCGSLKQAWLKHTDGTVSQVESVFDDKYRAVTNFNFAAGSARMEWYDLKGNKAADDVKTHDRRVIEPAKMQAQKLGLVSQSL